MQFSRFIAVHAVLASGDVDLCLVPEVRIELDGENGILPFLKKRLLQQGHAVIVVAEGAGEDILGQATETDAGGNRKLPAIGNRLILMFSSSISSKFVIR
jgi:6-phosphofructokinase 1